MRVHGRDDEPGHAVEDAAAQDVVPQKRRRRVQQRDRRRRPAGRPRTSRRPPASCTGPSSRGDARGRGRRSAAVPARGGRRRRRRRPIRARVAGASGRGAGRTGAAADRDTSPSCESSGPGGRSRAESGSRPRPASTASRARISPASAGVTRSSASTERIQSWPGLGRGGVLLRGVARPVADRRPGAPARVGPRNRVVRAAAVDHEPFVRPGHRPQARVDMVRLVARDDRHRQRRHGANYSSTGPSPPVARDARVGPPGTPWPAAVCPSSGAPATWMLNAMSSLPPSRSSGQSGALLEGHFKLSSGLHSTGYLQCALVLQHPPQAEASAARWRDGSAGSRPTVVLSPAIGGLIIGHEVGRALGVRAIFSERQDGRMTLRRGFSLAPADRVVVIEDVVTTGLSTRETIAVADGAGATVAGAGAIIDRSGGAADLGVPFHALVHAGAPDVPARSVSPLRGRAARDQARIAGLGRRRTRARGSPMPDARDVTALRTLKLTMAYDGTNYVGLAAPGERAVRAAGDRRGACSRCAATIAPSSMGAGRTDAGVHAIGQVASVRVSRSTTRPRTVRRALNVRLPPDIRVLDGRRSARSGLSRAVRRDRQVVPLPHRHRRACCSPFDRWFVWHMPQPCDVDAMRAAAPRSVGRHDFASFQARGSVVLDGWRTIAARRGRARRSRDPGRRRGRRIPPPHGPHHRRHAGRHRRRHATGRRIDGRCAGRTRPSGGRADGAGGRPDTRRPFATDLAQNRAARRAPPGRRARW